MSLSNSSYGEAEKILQIINPDSGSFTCVATALTRHRRCRRHNAHWKYSAIRKLLQRLPQLVEDPLELRQLLNQVGNLSICYIGAHQQQRSEIVGRWYNAIIAEEQKPSVRTSNTSSAGEDMIDEIRRLRRENAELRRRGDDARGNPSTRSIYSFHGPGYSRGQQEADEFRQERSQRREREREQAQREELRREEARRQGRREREQQEADLRERREREEAHHKAQRDREREAEARGKRRQERTRQDEARRQARREREQQEADARQRRDREEAQRRAEDLRQQREGESRARHGQQPVTWKEAWARHERDWANKTHINASTRAENVEESLPWPVKSDRWQDVDEANVYAFLRRAPECAWEDPNVILAFLKGQALRWHPDKFGRHFPISIGNGEVDALVTLVMQVINREKDKARKRQSSSPEARL